VCTSGRIQAARRRDTGRRMAASSADASAGSGPRHNRGDPLTSHRPGRYLFAAGRRRWSSVNRGRLALQLRSLERGSLLRHTRQRACWWRLIRHMRESQAAAATVRAWPSSVEISVRAPACVGVRVRPSIRTLRYRVRCGSDRRDDRRKGSFPPAALLGAASPRLHRGE
jgi:hypothetical protein